MSTFTRWFERVLAAGLITWLVLFVAGKLEHTLSDGWIEWDARAMALAAFRFHGLGLFPRDLGADLAEAMCPPGWRIVYWVGTLFTDPYQVSRLVPLLLLAVLLWQGYAFARARGSVLVGLVTVYLLARSTFVWDRIVGANPRGFGLPLVAAFLRYASEGHVLATSIVLVLQAAFYPSVLLFCAPAWAIVTVVRAIRERRLAPLGPLVACGLACGLLVAPTALGVDPRIGAPIKIDELAQLAQRSMWSLYPLPAHSWIFERAVWLPLQDDLPRPLVDKGAALVLDRAIAAIAFVAFAVAIVRRRLPGIFLATAAASIAAYFVACALAYRLYVPDRLVHYAAVPILLLPLAPLAVDALTRARVSTRAATLVGATVLVGITLVANGTGLSPTNGLHDWRAHQTPTMRFLAGLPVDVLVAAHPRTSSDVEVFARRSTLFSGITNAPNFLTYGRTVETRIAAFYDAYYGRTLDQVRGFLRQERVDYLVVDSRDFGPGAWERAVYATPWTERARRLLLSSPANTMALASPPAEAIVFRDGPVVVLDAKKL